MTYDGSIIIRDENNNPIPQQWDDENQEWKAYGEIPTEVKQTGSIVVSNQPPGLADNEYKIIYDGEGYSRILDEPRACYIQSLVYYSNHEFRNIKLTLYGENAETLSLVNPRGGMYSNHFAPKPADIIDDGFNPWDLNQYENIDDLGGLWQLAYFNTDGQRGVDHKFVVALKRPIYCPQGFELDIEWSDKGIIGDDEVLSSNNDGIVVDGDFTNLFPEGDLTDEEYMIMFSSGTAEGNIFDVTNVIYDSEENQTIIDLFDYSDQASSGDGFHAIEEGLETNIAEISYSVFGSGE